MNAKEEFVRHTTDRPVLCATIKYRDCWDYESEFKPSILKTGYTDDEYTSFIESLNYDYDSGYGGQELYGVIWYIDGTWSDRGEYDGSEWWEYFKCPQIPELLL